MDLPKLYGTCKELNDSCRCEDNGKGHYCEAIPKNIGGFLRPETSIQESVERDQRRMESNRITAEKR